MVLRRLLSSSVFLAFFLVATVARAQDASVIGTVTDETKSVLPGATVTATNLFALHKSGTLSGEVKSPRIQIEEGSIFQGRPDQVLHFLGAEAPDDLPEALASEGHGAEAELGHE